jgi:hypothetical protein
MNQTETIKTIRKLCKLNGLTSKKSINTFNNKPLYYFINRESGAVVMSNMTLSSALDNAEKIDRIL